jgi:SHS2 domain-containing protein
MRNAQFLYPAAVLLTDAFISQDYPLGYRHMPAEPRYEIVPLEEGKVCIKARGKTRAGLFTSAMMGLFHTMQPVKPREDVQKNERPFSIEAETPEALLVRLLNEALVVSTAHNEALQLKLITDTKAEGSFVGCAVTHFGQPVVAATDHNLEVKKNEETGDWEADICFEM